jgi:hypothetical protein
MVGKADKITTLVLAYQQRDDLTHKGILAKARKGEMLSNCSTRGVFELAWTKTVHFGS